MIKNHGRSPAATRNKMIEYLGFLPMVMDFGKLYQAPHCNEVTGIMKKGEQQLKDFIRDNLWFPLCGLDCGLCPMKLDGHYPGCGGGEGNQSCKIAKCSIQHGKIEYCNQCQEFPCDKYGKAVPVIS